MVDSALVLQMVAGVIFTASEDRRFSLSRKAAANSES